MQTFSENLFLKTSLIDFCWFFNPLSASVALICCTANQLTGFYMRATLALNGLSNVGQAYSENYQTSKVM